jgi:hypothetical protein
MEKKGERREGQSPDPNIKKKKKKKEEVERIPPQTLKDFFGGGLLPMRIYRLIAQFLSFTQVHLWKAVSSFGQTVFDFLMPAWTNLVFGSEEDHLFEDEDEFEEVIVPFLQKVKESVRHVVVQDILKRDDLEEGDYNGIERFFEMLSACPHLRSLEINNSNIHVWRILNNFAPVDGILDTLIVRNNYYSESLGLRLDAFVKLMANNPIKHLELPASKFDIIDLQRIGSKCLERLQILNIDLVWTNVQAMELLAKECPLLDCLELSWTSQWHLDGLTSQWHLDGLPEFEGLGHFFGMRRKSQYKPLQKFKLIRQILERNSIISCLYQYVPYGEARHWSFVMSSDTIREEEEEEKELPGMVALGYSHNKQRELLTFLLSDLLKRGGKEDHLKRVEFCVSIEMNGAVSAIVDSFVEYKRNDLEILLVTMDNYAATELSNASEKYTKIFQVDVDLLKFTHQHLPRLSTLGIQHVPVVLHTSNLKGWTTNWIHPSKNDIVLEPSTLAFGPTFSIYTDHRPWMAFNAILKNKCTTIQYGTSRENKTAIAVGWQCQRALEQIQMFETKHLTTLTFDHSPHFPRALRGDYTDTPANFKEDVFQKHLLKVFETNPALARVEFGRVVLGTPIVHGLKDFWKQLFYVSLTLQEMDAEKFGVFLSKKDWKELDLIIQEAPQEWDYQKSIQQFLDIQKRLESFSLLFADFPKRQEEDFLIHLNGPLEELRRFDIQLDSFTISLENTLEFIKMCPRLQELGLRLRYFNEKEVDPIPSHPEEQRFLLPYEFKQLFKVWRVPRVFIGADTPSKDNQIVPILLGIEQVRPHVFWIPFQTSLSLAFLKGESKVEKKMVKEEAERPLKRKKLEEGIDQAAVERHQLNALRSPSVPESLLVPSEFLQPMATQQVLKQGP